MFFTLGWGVFLKGRESFAPLPSVGTAGKRGRALHHPEGAVRAGGFPRLLPRISRKGETRDEPAAGMRGQLHNRRPA